MDGKTLSAKEIDEGLQQLDDLIEEGLSQVVALRDAQTPEEIGTARAEIAKITRDLEARAGA
jgi:hypothetical protein